VTALCRYRGIDPVINRELLDAACAAYFVDDATEAQPGRPRPAAKRRQLQVQ
jgi:hypothetical protein